MYGLGQVRLTDGCDKIYAKSTAPEWSEGISLTPVYFVGIEIGIHALTIPVGCIARV